MSENQIDNLKRTIKDLQEKLDELQSSKYSFDTILNTTPLSIWGVDRNYCLIYMSDRFKKRVNQAVPDKKIDVGTNILDLHRKQSVNEWKERYDLVFSGEELIVEDHFVVNEKYESVSVKMSPVWANNKIIGAAVFSVSISEQRSAEEDAEKQKERFYHIIHQINDLYYEVDLNGKLVELNPAVSKFTGYDREDLVGQDIGKLYYNEDDRRKLLNTITKDGSITNYELLLKDKNGEVKKVLINATLIVDDQKKPQKIIGIVRDVSEIDKMNKELIRFRHIIENSPVSIVITDKEANITYVNPSFCEISGYNRTEVIGQNPRILKSDYYSDKQYKDFWKELSSGKDWIGEFKNKRKDGTIYWEKAIISPIKDESGEIINYLAVKEDITELRKIREDLRNSEKHYKELYQNAPIAYMSIDQNGKLVEVNSNWLTLLGYERREVIGSFFRHYVTNEFQYNLGDRFRKHLKDNAADAIEIRLKTKEGLEREVLINCSAFLETSRNEDKKQIHCVVYDITERKKAEDEIRRLKYLNEKILSSMKEGLLVEDETGHYVFVNPVFLKMSGLKSKDIIGKHWSDIIPQDFLEETSRYRDLFIQGKDVFYNSYVGDKKGNLTPVIMTGSRMIENGRYAGQIILFMDVSQLKAKERELENALKEARLSDKLKTSFLANVSHEIRTPMNAILGFAEILHSEKDIPDDTREEYFRIINQKGKELLRLISEIVDISKIEAGALIINKKHFDVNGLIHSIYRQFKSEIILTSKEDVEIKMEIPSKGFSLYSDETRINQILTNLVLNAIKFTQKGVVKIGYIKRRNELVFFVKDTGPGISESDQKIIFDMFRQSEDNYTRSYGGTGLGLAICKNLAELLGGSIWVESEKEKGASFFFNIPIQENPM